MALLALIIYPRARVVRTFVCANCVRVYTIECAYACAYIYICACTCIRVSLRLFTCKNANAVSYVRLRACLRADLIKTQNAFARKIFQHSNALWVLKLSGCTIRTYIYARLCSRATYVSHVQGFEQAHILMNMQVRIWKTSKVLISI